jgi:Cdc6-like AAA superfamily ATPase
MNVADVSNYLITRIKEFERSTVSFVNRAWELNELTNTYLPITIVYGSYGQGKTKLAKMLVNRLKERDEEVIYLALRLADQKYKEEFLSLRNIYKMYYNEVGLVPKDIAIKFLGPLLIDPKGFKEVYKGLTEDEIVIYTQRDPLNMKDLRDVYSSEKTSKLIEVTMKKIKSRLTIIIDEFEDLIDNIVRSEGDPVARLFIDSILSTFRYAYDQNPGSIRLFLLVIPRTAIDIRSMIMERSVAWVGVTHQIMLGKLSEEDLLEYARRLLNFLLQREHEDIKLEDVIRSESIEIFKRVLREIPVTRFAIDLIKQVITDAVDRIKELAGESSYENLPKKLPEVLDKLKGERKLQYDIQAYLKLSTPSHDELIKNYLKILKDVARALTIQYGMNVTGPLIKSMQRGYESYYLEVIEPSGRGKERTRFIFWLRPTGIKPRRGLTIDKIVRTFDLERLRREGVRVIVYVVSFEKSRYLGQYVDILNACEHINHATLWIHDEVLKYALADVTPSGFIASTLRDFMNEEIKALVEDLMLKHQRIKR